MSEKIVDVTRQGWFERLRGAIGGVMLGVVLVPAATLGLFWNEGRAVKTARALAEGAAAVTAVKADAVLPEHEGKLVHVAGRAVTADTLQDPDLGVSVQALALRREVEMYQWLERRQDKTEKKLGGSTETTTTYAYEMGWSSSLHDSAGFRAPAGHQNPSAMPYEAREWRAGNVTLGAFRLSPSMASRIDAWQPVRVERAPAGAGGLRVHDGGIYAGQDPAAPRVGDQRIRFRSVPATDVSIVGRQAGGTFEAWTAPSGTPVDLLSVGTLSADAMFQSAKRSSATMTWLLRLVGFLVVAFGISAVFRPMAVVADVVPLFGSIMGTGLGVASLALAMLLSSATIATAWIFFRPLLALALFLLGGAAVAAALVVGARRRVALA